MKKVINGKKYDTDTAVEVGQWENMYDCTDFHWFSETLYRKRTGEYFLYGDGGPLTKYAETIGQNQWRGGEKIIPLAYENARKWGEEHMDVDDYEAEFGEVGETSDGDETIAVTVRIPKATKDAIDKLAAKNGRTRGDIVAEAVASMTAR